MNQFPSIVSKFGEVNNKGIKLIQSLILSNIVILTT